jgi:nucleotide-binding universal stress UspA family protein
MVVVVGVDLSDVSEHLLSRARDLVCRVDDAALHIVHVMPVPLSWVPVDSTLPSAAIATTSRVEEARRDLQALCDAVLEGSRARVVLHTPVGRAADEIIRIARQVGADVIVVEVHDHHGMSRMFHHSVVARIARNGPCSVLAIRDPARALRAVGASRRGESPERQA